MNLIKFEKKTLKNKDFRRYPIFVWSPIHKNENSEITEILQNPNNTEI